MVAHDNNVSSDDGASSSRSFGRRLIELFSRRGNDVSLRGALEDVIEEHHEDPSEGMTSEERSMLLNLLRFGEARVDDVMVPRADVVAVDESESLSGLLKVFNEAGHSRVPVYRETLDNPLGMYHIKDLIGLILERWDGKGSDTIDMVALRRPVLFVPPSMPALDLLLKMQATRHHMALVIDEYGGTDGLVTIEDVVEEIVGEIEDEHDVEEGPMIERVSETRFVVDARAEVDEFAETVGRRLLSEEDEEDIDTVGGLLVFLVDRVPQRGELISHPAGLEFEILDADPRRVKRLRVSILDSPSDQSDEPQANGKDA